MKIVHLMAIGWIALASFASVGWAADTHVAVDHGDIKWGPGPDILPPGAEAAVLYGNPAKEGLFALRLRFPAGYAIAPHTHPANEVVTIISGASKLGMGEQADKGSTTTLPAGSFFALPPGMAHFVYFDEPTEIQISTIGPWGLTYVNPMDDPRKTH